MTDQEVVIVDADGTEHVFPSGFDPKKAAAIVRSGASPQGPVTPPEQPGSNSALSLAAMAQGAPIAAEGAMRFATSPSVPRVMGSIARGGTTAGAVLHGIYRGNPTEVLAAPMEGWAAGKGGYFLGKGAQALASPVARGLEALTPAAEAVGKAAGPQGLLDLAQMAEPNRKDIGFLGIGPSVHVPGEEPPWLNQLGSEAKDYIARLYGRLIR